MPDERLKAWQEYAKDRYESARSGLIEFRGWARQLLAALAVVVGLEVNLLSRLLEIPTPWRLLPVLWLLVTITYQLLIAKELVRLGYEMVWPPDEVPRNPAYIRSKLSSLEPSASYEELLGVQYAEAYKIRRSLSRSCAEALRTEARGFVKSLMRGLLLAVAWGVLVLTLAGTWGP